MEFQGCRRVNTYVIINLISFAMVLRCYGERIQRPPIVLNDMHIVAIEISFVAFTMALSVPIIV